MNGSRLIAYLCFRSGCERIISRMQQGSIIFFVHHDYHTHTTSTSKHYAGSFPANFYSEDIGYNISIPSDPLAQWPGQYLS